MGLGVTVGRMKVLEGVRGLYSRLGDPVGYEVFLEAAGCNCGGWDLWRGLGDFSGG